MARYCSVDSGQGFVATIGGLDYPFSFSTRVRGPTDTGTTDAYVQIGRSTTNQYSVCHRVAWGQVTPSQPHQLIIRDASSSSSWNTIYSGVNTWYTFTCNVNSSTQRDVWVNGNYTNCTGTRNPSSTGFDRVYFNGDYNGLDGYVYFSSVAIWQGVALTGDDHLALYAGYDPRFVKPSTLKHLWMFDGRTDDEPDLVGGATAVASGSPTVSDHPRIIYPRRRTIFLPAATGGGDVTLTISASEGADTSSISATVTDDIALPAVEANDASSITVTLTNTVNVAASEAADTSALNGTVANTATVAAAEAADTSSITVALTNTLTVDATEGADTSSIPVDVAGAGNTAVVEATEEDDGSSLTLALVNTLNLDATEAADTSSITAEMPITTLLVEATEADDTSSITAVRGFLALIGATEGDDSTSLTALLDVTAILGATEADDTSDLHGSIAGLGGDSTDVVVLVEDDVLDPVAGVRIAAVSANTSIFTVAPEHTLTDVNGLVTFTITSTGMGGPVDLDFFVPSDPDVNATVDVTVTS